MALKAFRHIKKGERDTALVAHTRWPLTKAEDFCGDYIAMDVPVPEVNETLEVNYTDGIKVMDETYEGPK